MYLVGAGVHTLFGPGPDIAIATNAIFALVVADCHPMAWDRHTLQSQVMVSWAAGVCPV